MSDEGLGAAPVDPLDSLDRALLAELLKDPRRTVVDLARRIGVVRATVQTRLERLQRRGIVSGSGIAMDVSAIGYPITAFVTLQIRQGRGAEVRAWLAHFPEVLEIHTTAGTFDVICRVAAKSSGELQKFIDRIVDHPAIPRSHTSVVLSTPMPYRVLPLIEGEHDDDFAR